MTLKTGVIGIFDGFLIATEAITVQDAWEKKMLEEDMRELMDDVVSFKDFRRRFNESFMFGCVRRKAGFYHLPYQDTEEIFVKNNCIYLNENLLDYEPGVEPIIINYTDKEIKIYKGEMD